MQISRELRAFYELLIAFVKSTLNLVYFEIKDQSRSLCITEISYCETGSYLNVRKAIFHKTLGQITC